jgi:hypothetical protein
VRSNNTFGAGSGSGILANRQESIIIMNNQEYYWHLKTDLYKNILIWKTCPCYRNIFTYAKLQQFTGPVCENVLFWLLTLKFTETRWRCTTALHSGHCLQSSVALEVWSYEHLRQSGVKKLNSWKWGTTGIRSVTFLFLKQCCGSGSGISFRVSRIRIHKLL